MIEQNFKGNVTLKQEFINELDSNTINKKEVKTAINLLNVIGKWEEKYSKDISDFSNDELKTMMIEINPQNILGQSETIIKVIKKYIQYIKISRAL